MMTSGGAIQRPGETTIHEGWMMKRGPKTLDGWKRRWFVLRGSRMLECAPRKLAGPERLPGRARACDAA